MSKLPADSKFLALIEHIAELAKPPPIQNSVEWAEQHRIFPDDSAEPGPYRADKTPWIRYLAEAMANPNYEEIIGVMASQLGKTELLLNEVGKTYYNEPAPCLWVSPTKTHCEVISKEKLAYLIKSIPKLETSLDKRKETIFLKFINGVRLSFGYSGSGISLSSTSNQKVICDEIDFWEDIKDVGSAWNTANKRMATYSTKAMIGVSTPTTGDIEDYIDPQTGLIHWKHTDPQNVGSPIWQLWQEYTKTEFMVPCFYCNVYFAPHKRESLWFPPDATPAEANKEAKLVCPHCHEKISPTRKPGMVKKGLAITPGQWVEDGKVVGKIPDDLTGYSLFVSGLFSPWVSWGKIASDLVRARGVETKIQSIVNTSFGICYAPKPPVADWTELKKLCGDYRIGQYPQSIQSLTMFVDVQQWGLVWTVCGWSIKDSILECYVLDFGAIEGSTFEYEVWDTLNVHIDAGFKYKINAVGIDYGFNPSKSVLAHEAARLDDKKVHRPSHIVKWYCRQHPEIFMCRGSSNPMTIPFSSSIIDVDWRGKRNKYHGLRQWTLNTDGLKSDVSGKLLTDNLQSAGRWYLPEDVTENYLKEITSEYYDMPTRKWTKIRINDQFDCLCGNYALALMNKFDSGLPGLTVNKLFGADMQKDIQIVEEVVVNEPIEHVEPVVRKRRSSCLSGVRR